MDVTSKNINSGVDILTITPNIDNFLLCSQNTLVFLHAEKLVCLGTKTSRYEPIDN